MATTRSKINNLTNYGLEWLLDGEVAHDHHESGCMCEPILEVIMETYGK